MNDPVTVGGLFMLGLAVVTLAVTTYMQKKHDKAHHNH